MGLPFWFSSGSRGVYFLDRRSMEVGACPGDSGRLSSGLDACCGGAVSQH